MPEEVPSDVPIFASEKHIAHDSDQEGACENAEDQMGGGERRPKRMHACLRKGIGRLRSDWKMKKADLRNLPLRN